MYLLIAIYVLAKNKHKNTETIRKLIKKIPKIRKKLIVTITIITLITSLVIIINPNKNLKIYFIDVGQGDSTLICTQGRKKHINRWRRKYKSK